ncbi:MAG TPA: S-layer homology domain-containing protein [Bacillota bacterium]|nr:S-layer homology domain-containing protein [Bacillota bacterium]
MKKTAAALIITYVLCIAVSAAPGYDPGVMGDITPKKNEYRYSEVVFVTGEPILLEGTVEVSSDAKGSRTTLKYELKNAAKSAKLDRKVSYMNSAANSALNGQTTQNSTVDPKWSEKIEIGSDSFELIDYLFSRSGIDDDKTVIKYNVSNWNGKKTYSRNDGIGQVVIDISAEQYEYRNFWSSTETAFIKNAMTYRYKGALSDTSYKEVYGTVEFAVSGSSLKTLQYALNSPADISFRGGYIIKEGEENIISYLYDLPRLNSGTPDGRRNTGRDSIKVITVPTQTRLPAPTIKDIAPNYWAADDIAKAVSMDIISLSGSDYFRPWSFMSRGEFAKAVIKASDMTEDAKQKSKKREQLFIDVENNHPYAEYIDKISIAGIMEGRSKNRFNPDEYVTKAEAAAIIVRAMGLEQSANDSSAKTGFSDDAKVPSWAKKPINTAHRIGIIKANLDNEIEADKIMTRAECAEMINRFIRYLQYDIRQEYREKIINFGR